MEVDTSRAPRGQECYAAESHRWLAEYLVAYGTDLIIAGGAPRFTNDADGRVMVEAAISHDGVVGDRGSVNVASVRAGAARWSGQPTDVPPDQTDWAQDLSRRLADAEADARGNGRGLWGACTNHAASDG